MKPLQDINPLHFTDINISSFLQEKKQATLNRIVELQFISLENCPDRIPLPAKFKLKPNIIMMAHSINSFIIQQRTRKALIVVLVFDQHWTKKCSKGVGNHWKLWSPFTPWWDFSNNDLTHYYMQINKQEMHACNRAFKSIFPIFEIHIYKLSSPKTHIIKDYQGGIIHFKGLYKLSLILIDRKILHFSLSHKYTLLQKKCTWKQP